MSFELLDSVLGSLYFVEFATANKVSEYEPRRAEIKVQSSKYQARSFLLRRR